MCDLALSVRCGGHDWAGRALCDGLVIDLRGMNHVSVDLGNAAATIGGGARACDILKAIDPLGLAAVTGSVGAVGMAGLTLGGGYGPLSGRFGLALDNLLAAEVVLVNGTIVTATNDSQEELFWALRGGGGNFGVVTASSGDGGHCTARQTGVTCADAVPDATRTPAGVPRRGHLCAGTRLA